MYTLKPPMLSGDQARDLAALRDWAWQLSRSLETVEAAGSSGNVVSYSPNGQQIQTPAGSSGTDKASIEAIRKNAGELRDMIVKSAENMQSQIDEIELTTFYVKYADDFTGTYPEAMYNTPTANTAYMGVCSSSSTTAPTDPSVYTWSKIKGNRGADGQQGPAGQDGEDGQDGAPGKDGRGVSSTAISYGVSASATTEPSSWGPTVPAPLQQGTWLWVKTYYTYTDDTHDTAYTKTYVGTDGEDGVSLAVTSATKTGKVTTVVITDTEGHESTLSIADGEDGQNGTPGQNGMNGYVHTAWANSADGSVDFSTTVSANKKYLGVYTDNTQGDSTAYTDYSWSLIKGADGKDGADGAQGPQGIPGPTGADGRTTYLHIKYSNDGQSFTVDPDTGIADGETLGTWIGMYTDYTENDSSEFSAYSWKRFSDDTELRALITAGDQAVRSYVDSKTEEYNSLYVAKSEYGTFTESINSRIETTARGVLEGYNYGTAIQSMQDSINLIQAYFTNITGEIRRGIVQDPSTGDYVTGIAISQNLQFSGECGGDDPNNPGDGYTYYYLTEKQTFGLYTSTGWQFWIDGNKKGWFDSADGMLHVATIYVEEKIVHSGYWETKNSDINGYHMFEISYIGG